MRYDPGGPADRGASAQRDISVRPGTTRAAPIGIAELNARVKALIERNVGRFWVQGEISDFKRRGGHWYFCLRDTEAQISCVVWSSNQLRIPAAPDDGMQVVALAEMTFWPARGALNLSVLKIEAAGDGLWRKAMEETVARLRKEGLLDPSRKRPIPRYPKCVAVVTSVSGAALKDIVSVAHRRRPGMRIVVSSAVVQGDPAPLSICRAIDRVVRWKNADVLIVGRGGGSREDLWAFNDERVARAIASCSLPVISAVGHEIDITVCDLVADYRAATPSAAAEAAVPSLSDLHEVLERQRRQLRALVLRRAESASLDLRTAARDIRTFATRATERRRAALGNVAGRLNALSPLATLSRGYAVARDLEGATLTSVSEFERGMGFDLLLRDGVVRSTAVRPEKKEPA